MASVEELFVILRANTAPFVQGMSAASKSGESFVTRMGGTHAMIDKIGKATAAVGLGVAVAATKMAGDFEQQIKRLQTSAGESESNLKMVGDGILKIARDTGTATEQLTAGMYVISSAGIRGSEGLTVLKAAAEGAKAEQADLNVVSNALTSTMKAYKAPVSEAADYMSKYVAIVSNGKVSMQELSSAMPNVEAVAAAAGISFSELGGAMATMTTHGESAHQAAQWLTYAIRNLTSPNMVAVKAMEQLGLSSVDIAQKLGERGLTGTIRLISETILSKMGPDGLVLIDTFKKSTSASDDLKRMLDGMQGPVKELSLKFLEGEISFGDWRKEMKKLPGDQSALAQQFKSLADRANGFSEVLKAGGPATVTYQDQLKKIMGGANGMMTALQLGGMYMGDFEKNVAAVSAATADADGHVYHFTESQETLNAKLAKIKVSLEVFMIQLGTKLIPIVKDAIDWGVKHQTELKILAAIFAGLLTLAVLSWAGGLVMGAARATVALVRLTSAGVSRIGPALRAAAAAGRAALTTLAGAARFTALQLRVLAMMTWTGLRSLAATALAGVQALGRLAASAAVATAAAIRAAAVWTAQKIAMLASAAASGIATAAQWALNAAMSANPITLVIIALVSLAAIFVVLYNKVTWFRNAVNAVWNFLWNDIVGGAGRALSSLWDTVSSWWESLISVITWPFQAAMNWITGGWNLGTTLWNKLVDAWNTIKDAGSWFVGIGEAIINGISQGITNAATGLYNKLKDVGSSAVNAVKGALGIGSPSKVFANEVGRWIPEGVAAGVSEHTGTAVRAVAAMSRSLNRSPAALAFRAPGGALAAKNTPAGSAGSVTNINVHVAGSVMSERELYDTVQRQALRYGRRNPTTGLVYSGR